MRRFFKIFKQQINTSKTTAAFIAVTSFSVGIVFHLGQAHISPRSANIATKRMTDSIVTKRIDDAFATIATQPLGRVTATERVGDPITIKPVGNASAAKTVSDAMSAKSVAEAAVIKPDGDAAAARAASDPTSTKPIGDDIATKPASAPVATKKATTLADEWQDWQYCLAPSHSEHKIYLSGPIPMIGILSRADASFHEMLNKAGISHDEVQCPKAPNKRTLLFRQRYAIRLNEEIGNTIVTLNWEPDSD